MEEKRSLPARDRFIWIGLGLAFALVMLAFVLAALRLGARFSKPLPVYGQVGDFTLTNQLAKPVALKDLHGHVWIADIIFTRCAGPCLKMSREMKAFQQALPQSSGTRLVSLTTDPDYDTPGILEKYAARFGADPNRWLFLTGTKKQIAALATDSLKLSALEKKPEDRQSPADLFIHSTIFVLVDKQGQLRGVFESTGENIDPRQIKAQILAAARRLERET
jgi:protein SCO1/2